MVGATGELRLNPHRVRDTQLMKPNVRAATRSRPNRLLIALAAAWMILSLAIGGAVHADASAQADPGGPVVGASQD